MSEREILLKKLSAYAFAAYDWNLYLDTHPEDSGAIEMFRKMTDKAKALCKEFEEKYGPLTAENTPSGEAWSWINNPWPWDESKL